MDVVCFISDDRFQVHRCVIFWDIRPRDSHSPTFDGLRVRFRQPCSRCFVWPIWNLCGCRATLHFSNTPRRHVMAWLRFGDFSDHFRPVSFAEAGFARWFVKLYAFLGVTQSHYHNNPSRRNRPSDSSQRAESRQQAAQVPDLFGNRFLWEPLLLSRIGSSLRRWRRPFVMGFGVHGNLPCTFYHGREFCLLRLLPKPRQCLQTGIRDPHLAVQ